MNEHVTVYEVGPRDGLQNERATIATADKISLIDQLSAVGLSKIEVSSFVSPKWVPQLADASEVFAGIKRRDGVIYAALVPNEKGMERALTTGVDEVAVFAAASEDFSQKNTNCSIAESFERFAPVVAQAKAANIPVRGYISCITDCPYSGAVDPSQVTKVTEALRKVGCYSISLGDTLGKATPQTTHAAVTAALSVAPESQLAGHFHDTDGNALANIAQCLELGLRTFDAAIGGLGGCPYAPGAKGNVSTESVVEFLANQGMATGVNFDELESIAVFARSLRG